jgi:tripartite-type tricarboxylate transporter receptor subunit TctC
MAWRFVVLLWVCGLAVAASGSASAEAVWPTRPIRAIVPFAPGTGTDVLARLVFNQLSVQLGQQIVVENRGGAGGTLGAAMVAKSEPDGYTILGHSTTHTIAPALHARMPTALVISPSKGIQTVQALVAAAKANPGTLTFASAGVGSTTHLTAERFRLSAGFEAIHVPFRGGGFRPEVASGRIDFAFSPIAVAVPDIRDGRLLALAVSGKQRASALPDVPTTLEAGYPNSDYSLWMGIFVPAKTPRAIVDRLHDETVKALAEPGLRQRLAALDVEPMTMSPAEFDAYIEQEIVAEGALAKAAGLKPN